MPLWRSAHPRGKTQKQPLTNRPARPSGASEPLLLDALLPISIVTHTGNAIASPRLRPRFLLGLLREKKHDLGPLRSGDMDFGLSTYYPIFLYLSLIILFAVGSIFAAHVIAPRKRTPIKLMTYESGMDPIGDARQR